MNKAQRTIEQQGRRDRAAYNLRECLHQKRRRQESMFWYFLGKYTAYALEADHNPTEVNYTDD